MKYLAIGCKTEGITKQRKRIKLADQIIFI